MQNKSTKSTIRTMVIDDSFVFRKFLIENLPKKQQKIEIVGNAVDPIDAMRKIPMLKPDVITLDVEMPRMNGIEFLKELLPKYKIPVILVSSLNVGVFDALSYGAVDFVRKPDMNMSGSSSLFVQNLATKILIASQAKVRVPASSGTSAARENAAAKSKTAAPAGTRRPARGQAAPAGGQILRLAPAAGMKLNNMIIAIGASTGGTEATLEVLRQLPADTPGIVITQHMPKGFTQMYAERLNKLCQMRVKEAQDGDVIERGVALIAPGGDLQMKVVKNGSRYTVRCTPGEKVNGHRPSVDVLFRSVAQTAKQSAVGIILTGMGQDGAEGLLEMRRSGAYTIGQDKESCVVYGMPMVAEQIGGVCIQAACPSIASVLIKHLNNL